MKRLLISLAAVLSLLSFSPVALADYTPFPDVCKDAPNNPVCQDKNTTTNPATKTINNVVNVVAFLAGAAALFFIMFGGFRFITSNGDATKAASGRMTVLYAVIGLIVIIAARSIIGLVIQKLYG